MIQREQPQSWRELLDSLSNDEKKFMIRELGIQSKTWNRWVQGKTDLPRPERIRQILHYLTSEQRLLFLKLLQRDPAFSTKNVADMSLSHVKTEIPPAFYSRILEANYVQHGMNRLTTTSQLILLGAMRQLDPNNLGLSIVILKCTTPAQGRSPVRSLYHQSSLGTAPWNEVIEQKNFFVGSESLPGQALQKGHTVVLSEAAEDLRSSLSVYYDTMTCSAAAVLIQKEGKVAGCCLLRTTQERFFTAERLLLINDYVRLLATAIDEHEFYGADQLALGPMPSLDIQLNYVSSFHQRLASLARYEYYASHLMDAECEVRRMLEAELLHHSK